MVSGNKAQLVERILKHADCSVARTFDEDIEDNDVDMPSSSHDDTSSDSEDESTEHEGGSSGDDYVERSFQVLFIDDADIPEVFIYLFIYLFFHLFFIFFVFVSNMFETPAISRQQIAPGLHVRF